MDVTVQEQVENAINDTVKETGGLDFLFNNAGVGGTLQFETATMEDWKILSMSICGVYLRYSHCSTHHAGTGIWTHNQHQLIAGITPHHSRHFIHLPNTVSPASLNV